MWKDLQALTLLGPTWGNPEQDPKHLNNQLNINNFVSFQILTEWLHCWAAQYLMLTPEPVFWAENKSENAARQELTKTKCSHSKQWYVTDFFKSFRQYLHYCRFQGKKNCKKKNRGLKNRACFLKKIQFYFATIFYWNISCCAIF